jgi:regulator of sigma E protease
MITGIAAMIFGIMFLVVAHEFGHWIVARLCGMWTPVFSIGFGPRKYSLILGKFWDTEFRLSPIPLGGYVALPEMGDETSASEIAQSLGTGKRQFRRFPVYKRMAVAVAGVVMNVLVAFAMIFCIFAFKGMPAPEITSTFVAQLNPQVTIARDAGLEPNDVFLAVDGHSVVTPDDLHNELASHAGQPVVVHIRRGASELDVTMTPSASGQIGIMLGATERMAYQHVSAGQAFSASAKITVRGTGQIFYAIGGMLHIVTPTPGADASSVHSMIGIVQYGANAWQASFISFIFLIATISLNLAVFNILPIPVLDGGYVLFMSIEKLRGKPLSLETQNKLKMAFFYLLIGLFVFGIMNDIRHPLK